MGLFQRNPFTDENPIFEVINTASLGNPLGIKNILIIGLGNVGKEYENTRHNIGFEVINNYANKNNANEWSVSKSRFCHESSLLIGGAKVILCKPTTFMNESGKTVRAMQDFYKIPNSATLVVHDDLDIKFGSIRIRRGGSSGGNNGIKSVNLHAGEDYWRLRIGIGPKKPAQNDSANFVLAKFNASQKKNLPLIITECTSVISEFCHTKAQIPEETRQVII